MKKQIFAALIAAIILMSALFVDVGNAASQSTLTIQSSGRIIHTTTSDPSTSKTEFLIRYVWLGSLTSAKDVDIYVAAHPWGTGIMLTDLSSGILSIISYTGWNANQTWQGTPDGITYSQLKSVIDEFHKLGWKVIYSPGNTPTINDGYIDNYLIQQHPELIAIAGNGNRYDQIHGGAVMVNFFANYTSPDAMRDISIGQRLSDLYTQRLSQMISDGSFQWDGWFGVDGWNGFTNQGMYWVWTTNQPFGRWIGTNDLSKWYYGDNQSISEWAISTYAVGLPSNWTSYATSQKVNWITNNDNLQWWQYWQMRYAQFYGQINQVFDNRPSTLKVGTIISQDLSSTWADNGINNPTGMENLTMFAQFNSFNHYYIDCEWIGDLSMMGRYSAYVAGLVKSKIPTAHCISEMPIAYSGASVMPTWAWKQMYLSMIDTYSWNNGVQYRAVDPNWVLVWAPTSTNWNDSTYHGQEMVNWVKNIAITLNPISPTWLGPVEIQPFYFPGTGVGAMAANFTFAQFTDALNLNNTGDNIVSAMGTVFLDSIGDYGTGIGGGAYQKMLNLYASGSLNVMYEGHGYGVSFGSLFMGQSDNQAMSNFNLVNLKMGSTSSMTTLSSNQVNDPYAKWILGDTVGQKYVAPYYGVLEAGTAAIPMITYDDGKLAFGLYYNSTSGRFLYGKELSGGGYAPVAIVPRDVINRGIYWVSKCPVNSSDALADLKIFTLGNGDIAISMMNLRSFSQNMQLTLNLSGLGLDQTKSFSATWASNGSQVSLADLNATKVTLVDGADVLIIHSNT